MKGSSSEAATAVLLLCACATCARGGARPPADPAVACPAGMAAIPAGSYVMAETRRPATMRGGAPTTHRFSTVGFRCAASPVDHPHQ